jgi:hypothetical protein
MRIRRFRGTHKRVGRIRFSTANKWQGVMLALLGLLSIAAGGWLGVHFHD